MKKLIVTCITEDNSNGLAYIWDRDINGNGIMDEDEVTPVPMQTNGDFRSPECIAYLQEADIICTNIPFSLCRDYIKQVTDYSKKFLIICNKNAFTYKEIFPLIKEGKIRTGKTIPQEFKLPDGTMTKKVQGLCRWFTNLETHKADNPMELIESYNPTKFPKYDNYDAINVDKVVDIPYDYDGVIGLPLTIVDKIADDGFIHCSRNGEQVKFKLVALGNSRENFTPTKNYINPKKHKPNGDVINGNAINCVLAIDYINKPKGIYYTSDNSHYLFAPYARILITKNLE